MFAKFYSGNRGVDFMSKLQEAWLLKCKVCGCYHMVAYGNVFHKKQPWKGEKKDNLIIPCLYYKNKAALYTQNELVLWPAYGWEISHFSVKPLKRFPQKK